MKTPQEIQDRNFNRAVFGGYDMGEVDTFVDDLVEDYETLYNENAQLQSKIKVLVEKVEEYRSTEDGMRMALLTAKKMSEELLTEAKTRSEAMLKEAETQRAAMIREAEKEALARKEELESQVAKEEKRLDAAHQMTAEFVDETTNLVRQHLVFLQNLGRLNLPEDERPIRKFEVAPKRPAEPVAEESTPVEEPVAVEAEAPAVEETPAHVEDAARDIEESISKMFDGPAEEPLQFGENYKKED